jgi:hypothetical protein
VGGHGVLGVSMWAYPYHADVDRRGVDADADCVWTWVRHNQKCCEVLALPTVTE